MPEKPMPISKVALGATAGIIITILAGVALGRVAGAALSPELPSLSLPPPQATPVATPPLTSRFSLLIEKEGQGQVNQSPWPGVSDSKYAAGTTVQLEAIPAYGWDFSYWSGDASGTSPRLSLAMNSDKRLTVHFQASFASTLGLLQDNRGRIDQLVKKNWI